MKCPSLYPWIVLCLKRRRHLIFSSNICSIISFICSEVRAAADFPTDPSSKGDEVDECSELPMDDECLVDESTEVSNAIHKRLIFTVLSNLSNEMKSPCRFGCAHKRWLGYCKDSTNETAKCFWPVLSSNPLHFIRSSACWKIATMPPTCFDDTMG